jgi:hypothetical protein
MGDATAAERQRRYRRHKAGDHSECLPGRCPVIGGTRPPAPPRPSPWAALVPPPVTVTPAASVTPDGLGVAGRALWSGMSPSGWPADQLALLLQAARLADRLTQLDALNRGEATSWARIVDRDFGGLELVVDKALAEERQQALALKQVLGEIRAARGASPSTPVPQPNGGPVNVLDELGAARAARVAGAAGSQSPAI